MTTDTPAVSITFVDHTLASESHLVNVVYLKTCVVEPRSSVFYDSNDMMIRPTWHTKERDKVLRSVRQLEAQYPGIEVNLFVDVSGEVDYMTQSSWEYFLIKGQASFCVESLIIAWYVRQLTWCRFSGPRTT